MELKNYVNEIFDIAKENNMSWDIGMDMLLANIRNAGDEALPYYPGAEHIDYAALKPELEAMADTAVAYMKNSFNSYVRENLPSIIAARKGGGRFEPKPEQ